MTIAEHPRTTGDSRTAPRVAGPAPSRPRPAPAPAPPPVTEPGAGRRGRTLLSYLLVPRPGDMVKALLMPLAFGLGVLATGTVSGHTLLRAFLALVILELLVYPARYQWNDIRGFAADQLHPHAAERGRLPGPAHIARQRVQVSGLVAVGRIALAVVLAALPGLHLGGVALGVIVGVFGVAFAYEALRSAATGRSDSATPPITPALAGLWLTVGAGYVVRGLTGLAIAIDLREHPLLGVAAAVLLWAYGVAFVTSRWAVESLAFARLHDGRVSWSAKAAHAREHLLALNRWLPGTAPAGPAGADRSAADWAALRGRTPVAAPWNAALVVAGAGAALTGLSLTASPGPAMVAVAAVGGVASLAAVLATRARTPVIVTGAAVVGAALFASSAPNPMVAVLPWLAVMLAYRHFSGQSLAALSRSEHPVRARLARACAPAARLAVGRDTWDLVTMRGAARG